MRYIQRDEHGALLGHYAHPHPYALEEAPDDHPDIVAWQAQREATAAPSLAERVLALEAELRALKGSAAPPSSS